MKRRIGQKRFNKTIFILTQGTVTEVEYFKYFKNTNRVLSLQIQVKSKHETNAFDFVKYAIKNFQDEIRNYDEFWLVFDKDATEISDFNDAIALAKKSKCYCAYSIQAFEIWFIHHFKPYSTPLGRQHYGRELSKLLGFQYDKSERVTKRIVEELYLKFDDAIINSEQSFNQFDHLNPANEESTTTVFKLAKSIKEFKKN
jgi:hypothetical protein